MNLEASKNNIEWGHQQATSLWNGLYSGYEPFFTDSVVLDLGCSWGYMLKFILENFKPRKVIGTDISPLWEGIKDEWAYENYEGVLEFYAGELYEINNIKKGSVDYVICTSVFQYMRPETILKTLEKVYEILRPGGEMIARTRCFTSYVGADLHTYYDIDYSHLLCPLNLLKNEIHDKFNRNARYLNYLTASNYITLVIQSGLEPVSVNRRMNKRSPDLIREIKEKFYWISEEDLNCAELEMRLVRPIEPEEIFNLGEINMSYKK